MVLNKASPKKTSTKKSSPAKKVLKAIKKAAPKASPKKKTSPKKSACSTKNCTGKRMHCADHCKEEVKAAQMWDYF